MPTLEDVARKAGVSKATVSRVVGGYGYVSDETRRKVQAAVETLGYRPNALARSMVKGSTQTVGLLVSDTANPFYPEVVRGVEDVCHRSGFNIILCNTDEDPKKEREYVNVLADKQVDGLIIAATSATATHLNTLAKAGIPVVLLDRKPAGTAFDSVTVDSRGGARAAVSHLLALGHRRIGMITAPHRIWTSKERFIGYREALSEHGMSVESDLVYQQGMGELGGYYGAQCLMSLADPPTAIFTANILRTTGALAYLKERGYKIPGDVSIVGFDDMTWLRLVDPPVTVVAQPTYILGTTAAEILLRRVKGKASADAEHVTLTPKLIERASCAPPGRYAGVQGRNERGRREEA